MCEFRFLNLNRIIKNCNNGKRDFVTLMDTLNAKITSVPLIVSILMITLYIFSQSQLLRHLKKHYLKERGQNSTHKDKFEIITHVGKHHANHR